jgi:hypothetical protein
MTNDATRQVAKTARVWGLFAAIVLGSSLGLTASANAQAIKAPAVPDTIKVEDGNTAFLIGHALGSQGYVCLPASTGGTSWTVNNARPEATLFVNFFGQLVQVITHFASVNTNPNDFATKPVPLGGNATWQSSFDSSKVWAVATGIDPAGSDASCPNGGSIPCLRLQSVGNQEGPNGGRILATTSFVQRLNTRGGAAPTSICTVGQTQLVPYTADYVFFHKN